MIQQHVMKQHKKHDHQALKHSITNSNYEALHMHISISGSIASSTWQCLIAADVHRRLHSEGPCQSCQLLIVEAHLASEAVA